MYTSTLHHLGEAFELTTHASVHPHQLRHILLLVPTAACYPPAPADVEGQQLRVRTLLLGHAADHYLVPRHGLLCSCRLLVRDLVEPCSRPAAGMTKWHKQRPLP